LIEPKSEYEDGNDEPVEDLTMDDEDLLEDLEQAGPSHGGEGSSQGYAQWQVDRSQDEVFLAAQEAAGQHRDAQDTKSRAVKCRARLKIKSSNKKKFACQCGRSYSSTRALQLHKRWECGKPPSFKCSYCQYMAHHKGNIKQHIRKRH